MVVNQMELSLPYETVSFSTNGENKRHTKKEKSSISVSTYIMASVENK